jgi:hypothetical protein
VLKTICEKQQWPYIPDKDTLGTLLRICHENSLIPEPYVNVIQGSSGLIRNKWGGHGKGIEHPHGDPTYEIADNMIQITSSHILYIVKASDM